MAARRGSLRFKAVRFALTPFPGRGPDQPWKRVALRSLIIAGRSLATVAAALVAATIGTQVWRVAEENVRLHDQIVAVERQNQRLEAQSTQLSNEVRLLHYPEYLVPFIHEQLGLSKPHEVFITVKPRQPASPTQTPQPK
ncbi:MAG: septum formation initiator family protein [Candidatus Eremiobacteraeota bacterium]|nr:septum formation initiator family protein [Candidatus Eremiobacteraeota bacterium]MBC5827324.1 septum formation initiator family protein [Candidatus Eremiobacteraeota bacterium]